MSRGREVCVCTGILWCGFSSVVLAGFGVRGVDVPAGVALYLAGVMWAGFVLVGAGCGALRQRDVV